MLKEKEKDDLSEKAEKSHKKASDDLRSGAYRVVGDVYDTASNVTDDLQGIARQAGRRFRDFADTAEHATDTVTTKIRDNPLPSTLIALGVGLLVGSLFRSSSK